MSRYKRFHPDLWRTAFNFEAISSITTISDSEMKAVGHFRTQTDYCSLIFDSVDWNHDYVKYETNRDYSGVKLSFKPTYRGPVAHFDDIILQPSIPIVSGKKTYHVVMGLNGTKNNNEETFIFDGSIDLDHPWIDVKSEKVYFYDEDSKKIYAERGVDYDIDYIRGKLYTDIGNVPWQQETHIEYTYNTHDKFTLDFSNMYSGDHHSNYSKIPVDNIDRVSIPILPDFYKEGKRILTGKSEFFSVTFKDITIVNGELNKIPEDLPKHRYRIAEGYDDEYDKNPKRLVDTMRTLGYSKIVNFYIGASHFYDKSGKAGTESRDIHDMVLDPSKGINQAYKSWMDNYMYWLKRNGFEDIVISVAMENLQMPEEWKQRIWNGDPAATGWEPPTNFYSPNNPDVKKYIRRITRETINIAVDNGFRPILQLGESWYWWQEFVPGDINTTYEGRPPCIYDQYTIDRFKEDTGKDLPIYKSSDIVMNEESLLVANKMRQYLGEYTEFMRGIADEYENSLFTILFFPPSVLDEDRTPEFMRIINAPFEYWERPNLDFIQIEDYDWVVHDDPWHDKVFMQAWRDLDYPHSKQHYFSGFAWDQFGVDIPVLWDRIEKAGQEALGRGYDDVFIWAGTQVRRDDWFAPGNRYIGDYSKYSEVRHVSEYDGSYGNGVMYAIDLEGNEYPIMATSTNRYELLGNHTFRTTLSNNKINSVFIKDISEMWKIVDHDGIKHNIIYCRRNGRGNNIEVNIKAIPEFYDYMDNDRTYERYDEHMTANKAFSIVFKNTGYNFIITGSFSAIEWEGFGDGETKLESFKRAINRYKAEFRIVGKYVYIESQIGSDTDIVFQYRLNASNINQEIDAENLWTFARGYGDYGDGDGTEDWRDAKLTRSYTSPISKIIGIRHAPPIKNGNIKVRSQMDSQLKKLVDSSLKISINATIHDLRRQGYPIYQSQVGDRVFIVDPRLGVNDKVRVSSQEIVRDWKGKIIDIDIFFDSDGLVKKHQSKLTTAINSMSGLLDGRTKIPLSALDQHVIEVSKIINGNKNSIFKYMSNGVSGRNGDNPNYRTRYVGDAIGFSKDGGRTYSTAMSAELGIVADFITTGTLRSILVDAVEIYGSYIEGSRILSKKSAKDYLEIVGGRLDSHGEHNMKWIGQNSIDKVTIGFRNGQLRARNHTKEWSLFFNDYGISTFADGDGSGYPGGNASGAIEFHSYRYSGGKFRGLTIMSHGRTAIESSNPNGARIYLNPNGAHVHVADAKDNYYGISASTFSQSSSSRLKRDIKTFSEDALSLINSLNIREYKRLTRGERTIFDKWQVGLLVEETPRELLTNGDSIDLYSFIGYLAKSVQQLSSRLDTIEGGNRIE